MDICSSCTHILYLLLLAAILSVVTSQIYLPCDIKPVQGCTCWNPDRPIVKCRNLNLTWFPLIASNHSSIHTLDLSDNQLTFVPSGVLAAIGDLRELHLSHNQIRSIHRHAFQGKEQMLEVLDMSDNNLTYVPEQFGDQREYGSWALNTLNLASNHIRTINSIAFHHLDKLNHLDLAGNPIRTIRSDPWYNLKSLRELRLGFARHVEYYITFIPTIGLNRIESLSISRAAPQFIGVIQTWLVRFRNLRHLELTNMRLNDGHFTQNSLNNVSRQLLSLSLKNNLLHKIPGNTLESLTSLERLDLSRNRIGKFGVQSGKQVPEQLIELDLSRNRLRIVNPSAIVRLKQARRIDLSDNRISAINLSPHILTYLPHHVKLRLGGNPLRCDCDNAGIKTLIGRELSRSNGHLHIWEIQRSIRCGPGGRYAKQLLRDVPESVFECRNMKPLKKTSRKPEQGILKAQKPHVKNGVHKVPMENKAVLDRKAIQLLKWGIVGKKRLFRLEKPITSIYFNRNIHHAYLDSEANVDIPEEIAELLDIRRTALR